MKISRFTVHRPVLTLMGSLIVILLGIIALRRLSLDLMPDISFPTLSISTSYTNADPQMIEELISRPIEEAMSAVPGVQELSSTSAEGSSSVRLSFAWGTDLEGAASDVRDRLDRVIPRLPADAERPRLFKFDPSSMPIISIGALSDLDPQSLRQIIDDQVSYRLERIPGVASVDVWGGLQREIHVDLIPEALKALEIPLEQIIARIKAGNVQLPAGSIHQGSYQKTVRTSALYEDLEQLRETVIASRQGTPIRLRQVAVVEDSWQKVTRIARINSSSGIRLSVSKQSGKNTVEVAGQVVREIERINRDIPQIQLILLSDNSSYIRSTINNLEVSALYGGLLAFLVLLFFLRHLRSSLIIATSIPFSIIATFALIYFNGFTLNIMTLGGLALGIGMLVDNSIVVLENIHRLRETGLAPLEAAVSGTEEVLTAVLASNLTTLVVFLPLLFMRGISGVLYRQLAIVISFSLVCSLATALTLVPTLAARMLRPSGGSGITEGNKPGRLERLSRGSLTALEGSYRKALAFALSHPFYVISAVALLLVGCLLLVPLVGAELMPVTDQGQVRVSGELEVGTRLDLTDQMFKSLEKIVAASVPEAMNTLTSVGGGGPYGSSSHAGQININLKAKKDRSRSDAQIAADIRRRLAGIPGLTVRTRTGQGFFLLRMGGGETEQMEVEIRGYDLKTAAELAARVRKLLEEIPGVTDVRLGQESGSPETLILLDRQRAEDLSLSGQQVSEALQTLLSGTTAGSFRENGKEYGILVRLKDAEAVGLDSLLSLTVTNSEGKPVALSNVVKVRSQSGPIRIERKDQERLVRVFANISGRDMGSILGDARKKLETLPLPQGFSIGFAGDVEEQQEAFRELLISISLALLLVYMVMAGLFESLRDPFVVMFSVPLAAIGVILMLVLSGTSFNIQAGIGALMLGGIVVNNAILLVDHTNLLRRRDGLPLRQALEEAGRRRLRPILMTSLTTILALIPMALGIGEGAEVQAPLARTVIGGLTSATFITLLFIPVIYYLFEKRRGGAPERRPEDAQPRPEPLQERRA